ncbi:AAA family ATPase [Candidatus Woesearchaeota archaeon]|nr:AAA family ATPase [Candidatus Woesearchaeota archaeon]
MATIALVGLPGSGKSTAAEILEKKGFARIRFGDAVDEELKKKGWPRNEQNEKLVREELRDTYGMHAFALLNLPRIKAAEAKGKNVVIDGMRSLEEYEYLKEELNDLVVVVAVHASRELRHARLASRKERPLAKQEAESRDKDEVEKSNCLGPIARADATITNDGSPEHLRQQIDAVLQALA